MAQSGELQRLLDLCDEIRALRRKIQDPALKTDALSRLRRRSRDKLRRLATDLSAYKFKSSLKALCQGLQPEHFLVLATLLRRYLRAPTPYIEGRALLSAVFDTSYELLRGLELLQPDAQLRSQELIVVEHDEDAAGEADLLECRFRLADHVVASFLDEMGLKGPASGRYARPYEVQEEYLVDLKLLHNLYRARGRRLFSPDSWWRLRGAAGDRTRRAVNRRIQACEKLIEDRLARSPRAESFPLRRFVRDMGLTPIELLMVLHLLFLEFLDGNPYADVVSLLQLVSSSEEELLAHRVLMRRDATLRRREIIELEQMLDGRELTSECHLANWVVERLLGGDQRGPIDADEKLNFHLYLKRLGSSNFLQDL